MAASGQTNGESKVAVNSKPDAPIDLKRVGVAQDQVLTLGLDEAIRMALNNNNDIELARDDVKVNEALLLVAEGVYDPVISSASSFRRNSFRGAESWNTFSTDVGILQSLRKGGGSFAPIFTTSRTGNYVTGQTANCSKVFSTNLRSASFTHSLSLEIERSITIGGRSAFVKRSSNNPMRIFGERPSRRYFRCSKLTGICFSR